MTRWHPRSMCFFHVGKKMLKENMNEPTQHESRESDPLLSFLCSRVESLIDLVLKNAHLAEPCK